MSANEDLEQRIEDLESKISKAEANASFAKSRITILQEAVEALVNDLGLSVKTRGNLQKVLDQL